MSVRTRPGTPGRIARRLARAILYLLGVFLVARGAYEVLNLDPTRPETYRHDWGGPHYLGVIGVHAGPGVLVLILVIRRWRRTRAGRHAPGRSATRQG